METLINVLPDLDTLFDVESLYTFDGDEIVIFVDGHDNYFFQFWNAETEEKSDITPIKNNDVNRFVEKLYRKGFSF